MKFLKQNRVIKIYLLLIITSFLSEVIFRGIMHYDIWSYATLRIFLGLNIIIIPLTIIISFVPKILERILVFIIGLLISGYALIQVGFYYYLGVYISLGTSSQAGAVKDYIGDYLKSIKLSYLTILLPLLIIIIAYGLEIYFGIKNEKKLSKELGVYNYSDKKTYKKVIKNHIKTDKKSIIPWIERGALLLLGILSVLFFRYTITAKKMQNELQLESNESLFKNPSNPNIAVNQYGTSVFFLLDVKVSIKPVETGSGEIFINKPNNNLIITDYSRIIDDTAWNTLNENTTNKNYQILNEYFSTREITPKNSYTGLFKDKNAIFIMMESVNTLFIDQEKFPTLYKLYSEGYAWENAYSPRNACSTGNNEMAGLVSLYTIYRSCTYNNYKNNTYFESIFNLFNNAGYNTTSYHNYTDQYYYRNIIHPKMGSGKFYDVNALNIKYNSVYQEWPSDILLMDKAADVFLSDTSKPFMAWITTVTSHQPYTVASEFGNKYVDLYNDTGYPIALKRYLSKLHELDLALKELLLRLEQAGELNDTVLILYADHYPYGLNDTTLQKAFDYDITKNYEIDRTPFIIYNAEVKGSISKNLTSYMNIVPTTANLFDLNYDPRYYMGQDLFSETFVNRLVFADGSWQTDRAFYNATTGNIKYYGDLQYTSEEIISTNQTVKGMMKMSSLAITSNYFNYLEKGLKKYEVKKDVTTN